MVLINSSLSENVLFTLLISASGVKRDCFNIQLKPCFSEECAFRIWSPRLAFVSRGMSKLGFRREIISKRVVAPEREITRSASANRCGSSSFTYSNWQYPFRSVVLELPLPQRWQMLKLFNILSRDFRIQEFIASEP